MSLAALANRAPTNHPPHRTCTLCWLLAKLEADNPALHADLIGALSNPLARYTEISEALAKEGHHVETDAISRCVRGRCSAHRRLRG